MIDLEDNDPLRVDLIMTPNLYPLPIDTIILRNHGQVIVTSDGGAVEVVGDHVELEFKAIDFLQWVKALMVKSFWLRDSNVEKFVKIKMIMEQA